MCSVIWGQHFTSIKPMSLKNIFIYLFGRAMSQLQHVGSLVHMLKVHIFQHVRSSSPTRYLTLAPCIGSLKSQPLAHQGSSKPKPFYFSFLFPRAFSKCKVVFMSFLPQEERALVVPRNSFSSLAPSQQFVPSPNHVL